MSNENDKKSFWDRLPEILKGIAAIITAIGGSSQSLTTIAIAIGFSVTLSTVTIMYVPQVQEAILGPQGEPGPQGEQGIQGETGSPGISEVTQAELDELAIRIDELRNKIFDMDDDLDDHLSKIENIIHMINEESDNRFENDESILQVISDLKTFSTPDFDSGWVETNGTIVNVFEHNLDTPDIFVYILVKWYREWEGSGGPMVHQFYYGVDWYGDPEKMQGFSWTTYVNDPNEVRVSCYDRADELRVLVWELPS